MPRLLCVGVLAGITLLAGLGSAAASTTIDVRGIYAFDVCPGQASGTCTVNNFPQTSTIATENFTSGVITGSGSGGGHRWTVRGTVTANKVVVTFKYTDIAYQSTLNATISRGGNTITGTYTVKGSSSTGRSTATRISGAATAPPVLAQSADLSPVSGTVLIRRPGSSTFRPLSRAVNASLGSVIDARSGTVSLTVALPQGGTQSGRFHSGEFVLTQAANGTAILTLTGGTFAGCRAAPKLVARKDAFGAAGRKKPATVIRQLWGNARGKFTMAGRYGSTSVSGTIWLTQDRCEGTFVRVIKDKVIVVAYAHPKQKHTIAQGQHFLVPAP